MWLALDVNRIKDTCKKSSLGQGQLGIASAEDYSHGEVREVTLGRLPTIIKNVLIALVGIIIIRLVVFFNDKGKIYK